MGYIYAGGKTNQKTNALAKMGETNQKYLSQRVQTIRRTEGNFIVFEYLEIPNSTSAMTKAIEGHMRFKLECFGYKNIQNDHFEWLTTKEHKMQEYSDFAHTAIAFAIEYCKQNNIPYIHKMGNMKARRNVKRKKVEG